MKYLLSALCIIVIAAIVLWHGGEMYEKGRRDTIAQYRAIALENDTLTPGQKMFPDNPRYQSLIDQWHEAGILPVKE